MSNDQDKSQKNRGPRDRLFWSGPQKPPKPQCTHLEGLSPVHPDSDEGCSECLALGDTWVHLRMCLTCGHVACCNDSKNTHAQKHYEATGHPVMRSIEPGETWMWCYDDRMIIRPERS